MNEKTNFINNIDQEFKLLKKICSSIDLDYLLNIFSKEILKFNDIDGFTISLIDNENEQLIQEKTVLPIEFKGMENTYHRLNIPLNQYDINTTCFKNCDIINTDRTNSTNYGGITERFFKLWDIYNAVAFPFIENNNQNNNNISSSISFYVFNEMILEIIKTIKEFDFTVLCEYNNQTDSFMIENMTYTNEYEELCKNTIKTSFALKPSDASYIAFHENRIIFVDKKDMNSFGTNLLALFKFFQAENAVIIPIKNENFKGIFFILNQKKITDTKKIDEINEKLLSIFNSIKSIEYNKNEEFFPQIINLNEDSTILDYYKKQSNINVLGSIFIFSRSKYIAENTIKELNQIIHFFYSPIKNSLLYRDLKNTEIEMKTITGRNKKILEIAEVINNLTDVDEIYNRILKEIINLYHFDIGLIFIDDGEILDFKTGVSSENKYILEIFEKISIHFKEIKGFEKNYIDGATAAAFLRNTHFLIQDVMQILHLPMSEKDKKILKVLKTPRTALLMPIQKNKQVIGVIEFWSLTQIINISDNDINLIKSFCSFIGTSITNAEIYSIVEKQKKVLEENEISFKEDLYLAKKIQQSILSDEYKKYESINVITKYLPFMEVGGDIYDIYEVKKGYYRIFLADATGHGVQAALTTVIIKTEYDKTKLFDLTPNIVLKILNSNYIANYINLDVFFTCSIIDIDTNENKIKYTSAGHPNQYIIINNEIDTLNAEGSIIGAILNKDFKVIEKPFNKGDKIILFTDGVFEEFSEDEVELGEERLYNIIKNNKSEKIDKIIDNIIFELKKWIGKKSVYDDITIIGVEYK